METVRLRVEFDNNLVTKPTKEEEEVEGLKRCWVLLKPQHKTISDLSSHLLHTFHLHNASPHGLLLSMEGFVLPSFESTSIFKDKDIVRVRKKGGASNAVVIANENGDVGNELTLAEAKQPEVLGVKFLVNKEFDKESGGYESEEPDEEESVKDTPPEVKAGSKKRKAVRDHLSGSKRKKNKSGSAEKCATIPKGDGEDACAEQNGARSTDKLGRRSKKIEKTTPEANRSRRRSIPLNKVKGVGLLAVYRDCLNKISKETSSCKPLENGNGNVDASGTSSGPKKLPSRSARRKKAKRRWLREKIKAEREEQCQKQLVETGCQQSSKKLIISEAIGKENKRISEESLEKDDNGREEANQQPEKDSDPEDDIVPVVIRPGHIRFQSLKKVDADRGVQQNQLPVGSFWWNGITSKKKGQKWGREKVVFGKRNDIQNCSQEPAAFGRTTDSQDFNQDRTAFGRTNGGENFIQECTQTPLLEEETLAYDCIEFDKLGPYVSLPKEHDVIAYRLVELSSSWNPELSSYRVGKISRYDPQSNVVVLVPVPGCPIIPDKKIDDEESAVLPDTSLYQEDGSLEIEFQLLHEVRIVEKTNLKPEKPVAANDSLIDVPATYGVDGTGIMPNNHNEAHGGSLVPEDCNEAHASSQENGGLNAWKEINEALSAKKAELSQSDEWKKSGSSGRKPWAYKALRGSALGPTIALLRDQNEL